MTRPISAALECQTPEGRVAPEQARWPLGWSLLLIGGASVAALALLFGAIGALFG